jgi:SNF2 family DNA or RNA helicase
MITQLKTQISLKANHTYLKSIGKNSYITLIVAPAITLTQWKEEIEEAFDDKADIIIIKKTEDFIKWYRNKDINKPTYVLIGKETFKLSYATSPSYKKVKRVVEYKEMGRWNMVHTRKGIRDVLVCPDCGSALRNINRTTEDVFFEESDFKKPNKGNYKCCECKSILWSATYNKTKKTSVIDYIHRKGIMFNSVILDEAHESNNSGSIIGNSTRTLLRNHTKKVIALSGTNNNGYASSLHNLFMALCPNKLITDECLDVKDFVKKYGTLQAVTQIKDERRNYYSRGKAEIKDSEFKEIEGINPIVFTKYLASNSIFATLDDLKDDLPPLITTYVPVTATDSQVRASNNIFDEIKKVNAFNAKMYLDSIIKHYINNPFIWKQILVETEEKSNLIQPINLNIDVLPKEKELLKIVKSEYAENRKVWIYCDFNNGGQYLESETIVKRLKRLIEAEGLKVFMLSTSTSTYDRKEVIDKNKDKFDVFICNPRLVNVGINLVFCPTYIFFMPSYRVDIVNQSSKRGYRCNSTMENRIYHLYYENTIENEIIKRYQRKLAESNAINGSFQVDIEDDNTIRTASQFSSKLSINN